MTKDKCISMFQMEIFTAYIEKNKITNKEAVKIFDKNDLWNYINNVYELIEGLPMNEVLKDVNKVIKNGGYKKNAKF